MREIILKKRYPHSREEDITDAFMRGYEKGKADRPQGEWIEKAVSIIDDMQSEGIVDYEQAREFRMRARMKGADNE